jgi:two-component system, OmpR family, response regulator QseB
MRLLLVEDDLDLGAALSAALKSSLFEVVWVRRLADADAQLINGDFHAAVLDINLPDGEGFTLLKRLREEKNPLPIVIVTARESINDRLKAFGLGADDYVIKPFEVQELIARIYAITRRSAGFSNEAISVGSIRMFRNSFDVTVDELSIKLTPLEFKLLEHLMLTLDRVSQRDTLWNVLWGANENPSDNALEVVVHSLRKKVGASQIKTIRGVGYMFSSGTSRGVI